MSLHMNWFLIYLSFIHVYSLSGQLWWHWSLAHLDFFPVKAVMNRTWQLRPMLNGVRHAEFNSHGKYKWRLHWLYKASPRLGIQTCPGESMFTIYWRCSVSIWPWLFLGQLDASWQQILRKCHISRYWRNISCIMFITNNHKHELSSWVK